MDHVGPIERTVRNVLITLVLIFFMFPIVWIVLMSFQTNEQVLRIPPSPFFEPTLEEGKPVDLHFRIVISEEELDQAACAKLYDAYNGGRK